jgi:hypothetical protein
MRGNTVVVGADGNDLDVGSDHGAAYVFQGTVPVELLSFSIE